MARVTMCPNEHSSCVTAYPYGTGGKFRCDYISLHHIATIDDIYLNAILQYTGNSIPQLNQMTSFIKLIIT